ncbi:enhanced entry protein EnhA (plasmid) [Legionella adelaidensis]|uniref:Enhanced entry protein EnhA n=1 Tax=Legionella adelaidensis TaxID=45056 RepID=A0A0W0R537_9GAMM|nr:L,D-transpeptidase [Legionella adelaidensis]KTC66171.1 enhanced entry protein EnhA [Legionella adelaidensis]VEH85683.1 enhanced entry protein EnhA [Legionella adelaidensis]
MEERKSFIRKNSFIFSLLCFLPAISLADSLEAEITAQPIQLAANSFVYNPKTLTWQALKNGKVVRSGRGSGGKGYCKDIKRSCRTPSGTYRIISKGGPGCKSSRYPVGEGGAPMPYCMFFSKYYAIHGSPDVPNYNASHGCVRVKPSDARWLSQEFLNIGSKVTIRSY